MKHSPSQLTSKIIGEFHAEGATGMLQRIDGSDKEQRRVAAGPGARTAQISHRGTGEDSRVTFV